MLTKKQKDLLLFIHNHIQTHAVAPSFDEMKDALELKSKSGIHRLINALEERKFIRRLPNRARALEVLRLPDQEHGGIKLVSPDLSQNTPFTPPQPANAQTADYVEIPMHGKIAAGTPIEALEQFENITVPQTMLGQGSHYALQIEGDSMIEEGILDGDTVIIRRCEQAQNNRIVVALVDEQEATLKTLHKKGPDIDLIPANKDYQTQTYPANRVRIQGELVGLLRQY